MKKIIAAVLCLMFALSFVGCGTNNTYKIKITVPAGNTEGFSYSHEEISPKGKKITVNAGEGLDHAEVVLMPTEAKEENAYEPVSMVQGTPVKMDAEKGAWFKVGVNMQNSTDSDITVYVEIEGIEVRIE